MANNYSHPNMPELKRSLFGVASERSSLKLPGKSSATVTLGGFAPDLDGTNVAAIGLEAGIKAFADDDFIGYYIVGIFTKQGQFVLDAADTRQGTVTTATSVIPMKYAFNAANDQLSGASAKLEMVELMPIREGDILEVSLFNDAGTATVNRGTTTAYGTTGSSAHYNVAMGVNVTAQVGLIESSAAVNFANMDFRVVLLDGKHPSRPDRVYVTPIASSWSVDAAA